MKLEPVSRLQRVWKWVRSSILRIDRIPIFGSAILLYLLWTVWTNQVSLFTTVSQLVLTVVFVLWIVYDIRRKWDWSLWFLLMAAVLAIGIFLSLVGWGFLHGEVKAPASPTIRNLGLLIGGAIAAVLAFWRSKVAEDQANTAQLSLLNERYQKGAEMLGNEVLSVRLGGIYALERLATEHPEQYHVQVMKLFCAFARNPTKDDDAIGNSYRRRKPFAREDVEAAMEAIRDRNEAGIELERSAEVDLVLDSAYLRGLDLRNADLVGAKLIEANLSNAQLDGADLSGAWLCGSNLSGATLSATNLSGANFGSTLETYEEDGLIEAACGLTQRQLDQACADTDNLPRLEGYDPATHEPLEWHCRVCEEE